MMAPGMARGRPYDPVAMTVASVMPPRRKAGGEAALARFGRRHALRAPEGTARLTIRAVFALLRALLTAFLIKVLKKLLSLRVGVRLLAFFTPLGALRAVAADFLAPLGTLRRRQRAQAALLAAALDTLLLLLLTPLGTVLPLFPPLFLTRRRALLALLLCRIALLHGIRFRLRLPLLPGALLLALLA
jgi:hypothetical protein